MMDEVLEIGSSSPARTLASEFLILKGALLLMLSPDNTAEAEVLYQQAVLNARDVHTPMLELRAAIGLSHLWQEQGKKEQAQKVLNEAYSKITEGFATADLKEASALLADLSE
jgi:predicted ATPase